MPVSKTVTTAEAETTTAAQTTEVTPEPVIENPKVRFFAAGDNLIHSSIYNQAKARAKDGGYDFSYAYQYVKGLIPKEGIRILNQETTIANDIYPPSDYPCFNSPTQLGDTMIGMGFNVFSNANNHALDKGVKGLLASIDYWESRKVVHCGTYRNEEDMLNIKTKDEGGIRFSFLGFTEQTNGIVLPASSDAKIVYTSETEQMKSLVQAAAQISDVVVVCVHWGVENSNTVTDSQRSLAKQLSGWGANIIIGTHPHTIQSMEYIDNQDGSRSFVFYSLGNFISAQSQKNLMVGMVADFYVTKDMKTDSITISDVKAIPIINQYEGSYQNIRAYPYSMYTDELGESHGVYGFDKKYADGLIKSVIPEEFLYLK